MPDSDSPLSSRGEFRSAFRMSLFFQTACLAFTALLLDGGEMFRVFLIAALAYWTIAIIVATRRPRQPTLKKVILIRYGFPLAVACTVLGRAAVAALS
jgi:hypothetical protein